MEYRVLRYFLAVAKAESIVKAAEALYITQPTLSRQIMELEEELGVKLLNRGNRSKKILLTDEGMLLRKRAEEIIELTEKTMGEFHKPQEDISGIVYIGGGETEAMRLIAKTALELQTTYPQISYHLYSGNADDVTERLDKGLLDFGILIEPADMERYNYIRLPVSDLWGLLMVKDSPLALQESIQAKDLENLPLIVSRQSQVANQISGWKGLQMQNLNIVATYNLLYNAALMVDEGFGYALCLDKLISTTNNNNLCFRPLAPKLEAHLNIVWKKYQVFSPASEKFLEKFKELLPTF